MVHQQTTMGYRVRRHLLSHVVPGTDLFRLIYGSSINQLPLPLSSRGNGFLDFVVARITIIVNDPLYGSVFSNENAIYKESYNQGEMFGFESIVTPIYHSTTTANTMVTAMSIKKSCI